MAKHLIVTTCGTSLLTNGLHREDDVLIRQLLQGNTNLAARDIPVTAREPLDQHISDRRERLLNASIDQACQMSAELNGTLNFYGRQTPLSSQDAHILIHTNTWLGERVAGVLADKLKQLGAAPQLHCAASLNTVDLSSFQTGLGNLVEWAAQTLPGYRDSQYHVVFNLVGGFKSMQGFMQTLGMFYADEILYIFESGSQLLRIPKLPVDLDASAKKVVADYLPAFRLLDILKALPASRLPLKQIPDSFFYQFDNETELSPWGKIVWNQAKPPLYEQRLQESPTDRIVYTEKFRNDASKLPPERLAMLNTRIDDLTRFLLDAGRPNPKRLDVKPLKGNPMPPSDHECDAWADADCRRIFLRLDNGQATLHRVTSPLH